MITAAYGPKAGFLDETAASVAAQTMPAGWEFEWLVQEDGTDPVLHERVGHVDAVRYEPNCQALGVAATRNVALSRARGELVRVLDHDDVLLADAFARPLPHFTDPDLHWTVSAADELDHDGAHVPAEPPPRTGRVPRGTLGAVTDDDGRWSVLCAGMTVRTESVRALGGWIATPRSEDVGLLTVLAELSDGYVDERVGWYYRRHPVQSHLDEAWQRRAKQGARLVRQRLAAARGTGLRFG